MKLGDHNLTPLLISKTICPFIKKRLRVSETLASDRYKFNSYYYIHRKFFKMFKTMEIFIEQKKMFITIYFPSLL